MCEVSELPHWWGPVCEPRCGCAPVGDILASAKIAKVGEFYWVLASLYVDHHAVLKASAANTQWLRRFGSLKTVWSCFGALSLCGAWLCCRHFGGWFCRSLQDGNVHDSNVGGYVGKNPPPQSPPLRPKEEVKIIVWSWECLLETTHAQVLSPGYTIMRWYTFTYSALWHTFVPDGNLEVCTRPGRLSRLKLAWKFSSTPCTVYLTDVVFRRMG